jgi:glycosyltransferase involved in cell wall biosynthesis
MSLPTLSIITPSLNQGEFIEATINSVLDQNYPGLEYLVMDGGSTDGTLAILRRYQGRLAWASGADAGQGAALNEGFRRTQGDIVGWINSDDLYDADAFGTVGTFFAEHPEFDWVFGRCPIIDSAGRVASAGSHAIRSFGCGASVTAAC